jgi:rod shape-determining protein MreD
MIRPVRLSVVLLGALVVARVAFDDVRLFGAVADPLLLVAVSAGAVAGADRGARIGFVTGVVADLFLQTPLGLSALSHTMAAYVTGGVAEMNLRAAWWITVGTAMAGSAFGVMVFALAGGVIGITHLVTDQLAMTVLSVAILNGILALPAATAVGWACTPRPGVRAGVGGAW